jgi:uncharacterized protein YndB with AHSA1/START domain
MTMIPAVEVTLHLAARPCEVFAYLTDPTRYVRWMGSSAVLDARPGGRYEITMSDGFRASGTYIAADPPHYVAFTWGFADDEAASRTKETGSRTAGDMPAGSTRVMVTLAAAGGGTHLTLRHDDLPSEDLAAAHQVAWDTYLPRLAAVAAGADPGPDPHSAS